MRRRILVLVVGLTTLVVVAFAVPIAVLTRAAVAQRADAAAQQQAASAADFVRLSSPSAAALRRYVTVQQRTTGRPMAVALPDGSVVGSLPPAVLRQGGAGSPISAPSGSPGPDGRHEDHQARDGPASPDRPVGEFGGAGPIDVTLRPVAGGRLAAARVPTSQGFALVAVYLSDAARYAGVGRWYGLIIGGSLGLLALAVSAGELMTRRIARPLARTALTAQQLAGGDTSARAPVDGPREVADVGLALNRLADRIDELIAEERETVADLSHRLRTPLTSLRLDAEALRDPVEAERVSGHVSELERRLTSVIRAARRPQREGRLPVCDATAVVGERVAFWSALTEEQRRASTIELPGGALPIRAAGEDLAAAVDALLENVVAHTPEGVGFAVRLSATDGGGRLEVADHGPGLPPLAEVRGRSDRGSTGLGLDIARRCAESAGGAMTIGRSSSGGASVQLTFRAP